jgi:hypothetical protein
MAHLLTRPGQGTLPLPRTPAGVKGTRTDVLEMEAVLIFRRVYLKAEKKAAASSWQSPAGGKGCVTSAG